jgi:hypothetical protein
MEWKVSFDIFYDDNDLTVKGNRLCGAGGWSERLK